MKAKKTGFTIGIALLIVIAGIMIALVLFMQPKQVHCTITDYTLYENGDPITATLNVDVRYHRVPVRNEYQEYHMKGMIELVQDEDTLYYADMRNGVWGTELGVISAEAASGELYFPCMVYAGSKDQYVAGEVRLIPQEPESITLLIN